MIKKLAALAATALFSMNASAGYVQYNLTGAVSGLIVQHDGDKSIAYYDLSVLDTNVTAHFSPSGIFDNITMATTFFVDAGPTNFEIFDDLTDYYYSTLNVGFLHNSPGVFSYGAFYTQAPVPYLPFGAESFPLRKKYYGLVSVSAVAEELARSLDAEGGYGGGLNRIVPEYSRSEIPEPTSIALFALGAVGVAGASRRRKGLE